MGYLLSSREGIIWIRLMMASRQPHGLEGQEERELTHGGCDGKPLAQHPLLGKPLSWVSFPPASSAPGGDHGWEAGAIVPTVF